MVSNTSRVSGGVNTGMLMGRDVGTESDTKTGCMVSTKNCSISPNVGSTYFIRQ